MHKQENLSKNQQIVLDYIEKVNEPIKAYSILHNVQKKGIKALFKFIEHLINLLKLEKFTKLKVEMLSLHAKIQIVRFLRQQHFQYVKAVKK